MAYDPFCTERERREEAMGSDWKYAAFYTAIAGARLFGDCLQDARAGDLFFAILSFVGSVFVFVSAAGFWRNSRYYR